MFSVQIAYSRIEGDVVVAAAYGHELPRFGIKVHSLGPESFFSVRSVQLFGGLCDWSASGSTALEEAQFGRYVIREWKM